MASSKSLKRRDKSPLLAAADRLLKTGDGLGEKLPLTKSQMLLAPPFKPGKVRELVRLGISYPELQRKATAAAEAHPGSSGRRRWVFPADPALAWPSRSTVDAAVTRRQTAGTGTGTGTGS